jgi:replicative DNA helicase
MLRILCEMLSQGKKCVVFSTEVRRDTFIQLLASAYYKKNKHDLYQDKFQIPWGEFSELPLYFYDSVDNLSIIKHLVANHVTNGEADVVFIDYAQNISVDGSKDEYSAMSSYARAVQKLAIKHNIALIDLSQMSNE